MVGKGKYSLANRIIYQVERQKRPSIKECMQIGKRRELRTEPWGNSRMKTGDRGIVNAV